MPLFIGGVAEKTKEVAKDVGKATQSALRGQGFAKGGASVGPDGKISNFHSELITAPSQQSPIE